MVNPTLTPKQQVFATEYLIDLNATQAAIRAGYSGKTAESQASRLLRNVKVKERIQELADKRAERTQITSDKVLEEIAKIAFSNIADYIEIQEDGTVQIDLSKLNRGKAAALSSVTVDEIKDGRRIKLNMCDKLKALDQLGRHLKLFTDRIEHDGDISPTGFNITFVDAENGREA